MSRLTSVLLGALQKQSLRFGKPFSLGKSEGEHKASRGLTAPMCLPQHLVG